MAQMEDISLLDEAYKVGEEAAWLRNKEASSECVGAFDVTRIQDAYERAECIADILGDTAWERFAEGFDATIDFSLNADWREEVRE